MKTKRILAGLLSTVMCLSVLAGCGKQEESKKDEKSSVSQQSSQAEKSSSDEQSSEAEISKEEN